MQSAHPDMLTRIKNGDEQAFKELFTTQYAGLCGYANKFVDDLDQSEEIVQELFLSIWQKRDRLEITASLEAYLFRAVRNACLNALKHLKIKETYKAANKEVVRQNEASQGDAYIAGELEEKIEIAVESLPPERKKIFKMSRYDGKKYKEIADELNLSVKTVEAQMGKALKYLREALADYFVWIIVVSIALLL